MWSGSRFRCPVEADRELITSASLLIRMRRTLFPPSLSLSLSLSLVCWSDPGCLIGDLRCGFRLQSSASSHWRMCKDREFGLRGTTADSSGDTGNCIPSWRLTSTTAVERKNFPLQSCNNTRNRRNYDYIYSIIQIYQLQYFAIKCSLT